MSENLVLVPMGFMSIGEKFLVKIWVHVAVIITIVKLLFEDHYLKNKITLNIFMRDIYAFAQNIIIIFHY